MYIYIYIYLLKRPFWTFCRIPSIMEHIFVLHYFIIFTMRTISRDVKEYPKKIWCKYFNFRMSYVYYI